MLLQKGIEVEVKRLLDLADVTTLGIDVDEHMVALHEVAAYNLLGDAVDHFALDEALERTSAENRI